MIPSILDGSTFDWGNLFSNFQKTNSPRGDKVVIKAVTKVTVRRTLPIEANFVHKVMQQIPIRKKNRFIGFAKNQKIFDNSKNIFYR